MVCHDNAAWNDKGLWIAVYWNEDRFAGAPYRAGKIPKSAHAKLTLEVHGKRQVLDLDDAKALTHRDDKLTRITAIVCVPRQKRSVSRLS